MITHRDINALARLLATGFYIGRLPIAPGTWGSLAAVFIALGAQAVAGFVAVFSITMLFFLVGIWAVGRATEEGPKDPPTIVIDEMAGQCFALWPVSLLVLLYDAPVAIMLPGATLTFVLFRVFDILKPWPIRLADAREGPFWVMFDDILAAAMAIVVLLLWYLVLPSTLL